MFENNLKMSHFGKLRAKRATLILKIFEISRQKSTLDTTKAIFGTRFQNKTFLLIFKHYENSSSEEQQTFDI